MPLVVNRNGPQGSTTKTSARAKAATKSARPGGKRGSRKAAGLSTEERLRIIALTLVILVAGGATGWYLLRNHGDTGPITVQKPAAVAESAALAPRQRGAQTSHLGFVPGMPAPSLPGGAPAAATRREAAPLQPATEGAQEPTEGIH